MTGNISTLAAFDYTNAATAAFLSQAAFQSGQDLKAGSGDDLLRGGDGADEFRYAAGGEGIDRIEGFGPGDRVAIAGTLISSALQVTASDSSTLLSIDTNRQAAKAPCCPAASRSTCGRHVSARWTTR